MLLFITIALHVCVIMCKGPACGIKIKGSLFDMPREYHGVEGLHNQDLFHQNLTAMEIFHQAVDQPRTVSYMLAEKSVQPLEINVALP